MWAFESLFNTRKDAECRWPHIYIIWFVQSIENQYNSTEVGLGNNSTLITNYNIMAFLGFYICIMSAYFANDLGMLQIVIMIGYSSIDCNSAPGLPTAQHV